MYCKIVGVQHPAKMLQKNYLQEKVPTFCKMSFSLSINCLQNSLLPPSERMKPQTEKDPTGPYNRRKLLQFLEKKAKDEKDWENVKAYVKKEPGIVNGYVM